MVRDGKARQTVAHGQPSEDCITFDEPPYRATQPGTFTRAATPIRKQTTTHSEYATMPAPLELIKAFECTYKDCDLSFDTEKKMRKHKKVSEEHDYCAACDMDFDSYDDLAQHKIFRPDKHNLACRICGEEFKCKSGLKRHIELGSATTRHDAASSTNFL